MLQCTVQSRYCKTGTVLGTVLPVRRLTQPERTYNDGLRLSCYCAGRLMCVGTTSAVRCQRHCYPERSRTPIDYSTACDLLLISLVSFCNEFTTSELASGGFVRAVPVASTSVSVDRACLDMPATSARRSPPSVPPVLSRNPARRCAPAAVPAMRALLDRHRRLHQRRYAQRAATARQVQHRAATAAPAMLALLRPHQQPHQQPPVQQAATVTLAIHRAPTAALATLALLDQLPQRRPLRSVLLALSASPAKRRAAAAAPASHAHLAQRRRRHRRLRVDPARTVSLEM